MENCVRFFQQGDAGLRRNTQVPGRQSEAIGKSDRRQTLGADGCEKGLLRRERAVYSSFHWAGCQDTSRRHADRLGSCSQRPLLLFSRTDRRASSGADQAASWSTATRLSGQFVLRARAGTILPSGTRWPIASFGSAGGHSLYVGTPDTPGPDKQWMLSPVTMPSVAV